MKEIKSENRNEERKNEVFITVVMPVLNGMPYFSRALESVCQQTLKNIEILIIDAESDDGTKELAKQCETRDNRVRLIETDKRSAGHQCNLGVELAKGEYIAFVESDDYIDLDMMERLYRGARRYGFPDVVKSDFVRFADTPSGELSVPYGIMPPHLRKNYGKILSLREMPELLMRDFNIWNGIYRKVFLHDEGIRQNNTSGAAFQDNGFNISVQLLAHSMVYLPQKGYHCRRDNAESSMYKKETGRFLLHEMDFMMSFLSERPMLKLTMSMCVLERLFRNFAYFYGKNRYANKPSDEYEREVDDMQYKLGCFIRSLGFDGEKELQRNQLLSLFLESRESFRAFVDENEWREKFMQRSFSHWVCQQSKVVIFGAGETGSCVAALLLCNHYRGKMYFCDNNETVLGKEIYGICVLSPALAAHMHSDAGFIVPHTGYADEMRMQLLEEGINYKKIVNAPVLATGTVFGVNWKQLEELHIAAVS